MAMPRPLNVTPKAQQLPEESKSKIRRVPVSQWRARNVEEYDFITLIGRGTFGKVYKAKLKNPTNAVEANEIVALKKLNMAKEEEGFPITALREIQILKKLKHNNVVNLKDIVVQRRKHRSCNEYST
jgi:serine/threonine protein kinase